MTAQDVFNSAVNSYNSAKATIRELSRLAQQVDGRFSYEVAMREFDSILQSIMITVAAADGQFTNYERQLIEKITDYADILQALSSATGNKLTWDDLEDSDAKGLATLALLLVDLNDGLADEFVQPFAVIDAVLAKDYLDELASSMIDILGWLAIIDGDDEQTAARKHELDNAVAAMNKLIVSKWLAVTGGK